MQEDLHALRDKYERMLSLRRAHDRARTDPRFVEPDPRPEMARLADEYPGSLREIDTLPLAVIVERLHLLQAVARDPSRAEPWMIAQSMFHRFARAALATKRWLAGRKAITPAIRAAFARGVGGSRLGPDAKLFAHDLERVASPPRGRLMDLVHAKVAAALEVTEAEARALVFGIPRTPAAAPKRKRTKA